MGHKDYNGSIMKILLCNDDGITAPGLLALYQVVRDLGEVTVVAPSAAKSAMSHAVTVGIPITCQKMHVHEQFWGYSVAGSPADCVKLALGELMPQRPDLVLSGINFGANVGIDIFYSGTVAAAAEGAMFGVTSIAVSLEIVQEADFERAGRIARKVIDSLLAGGIRPASLVNVNIPALEAGVPKGVRLARQSTLTYEDRFEKKANGQGETLYILRGDRIDAGPGGETDLHALREGYVSVTPLQFDLTDQAGLPKLASVRWPERF
jgi:5'-nucleotidase